MSIESGDSTFSDSRFLEALVEFEKAVDAGTPLTVDQLIERYPECEPRLREYFQDRHEADQYLGAGAEGRKRPEFIDLKSFGYYSVMELIDWGGTASIHRIDDSRFDRTAAIKIPLKRLVHDDRTLQRLKREARFSGRLQHPSIVPVYDVGTTSTNDGEVPYFTMRLIHGSSLAELLKDRPNPQNELARFIYMFRQICYGVAHAHSEGILHCDLKPENIMVGKFDDPYVMDWGFAKDVANENGTVSGSEFTEAEILSCLRNTEDDASLTVKMPNSAVDAGLSEGILGTPCYLPPEVARSGICAADKRADVFCLGGILCRILTGTPTFMGASDEAFFLSRSGDTSATFSRLNDSGADQQLILLAKACLSPEPGDRPADANSVAMRVSAYIRSQEEAQIAAERNARLAAEARARAENRSRRIAVALGAVVLASTLLIAGTTLYFLNREYMKDIEIRQADEAREVESIANEVKESISKAFVFISNEDYTEAEGALLHARGRLGNRTSLPSVQELTRAEELLDIAKQLDNIRDEANVVYFDPRATPAIVTDRYLLQFSRLKSHPIDDPESAGATIGSSPIRKILVAALDTWATVESERHKRIALLLAAKVADPDPAWGDLFRNPEVRLDKHKFRNFAENTPLDGLSIQQLQSLAAILPLETSESNSAFRILRHAEKLYPNDFWINQCLATHLYSLDKESQNLKRQETVLNALSYARTASAIRPQSLGALYLLATTARDSDSRVDLSVVVNRLSEVSDSSWIRHLVLAQNDIAFSRPDKALGHLRQVKLLEPNYDVAALEARSLRKCGEFKEADRIISERLKSHPQDSSAKIEKIEILYDYGEDIAAYRMAESLMASDEVNRHLYLFLIMGYECHLGRLYSAYQRLNHEKHIASTSQWWESIIGLEIGSSDGMLYTQELRGTQNDKSSGFLRVTALVNSGRYNDAKELLDSWRQQNSIEERRREFGVLDDFALFGIELALGQMVSLEEMYPNHAPVPTWEELLTNHMSRSKAIKYGNFFFAKRAYVLATQAYEYAMRSSAFAFDSGETILGVGNLRMRAAMAAAMASWGSGRDALRADDQKRNLFREQSLRWIQEEVADCKRTGGSRNMFMEILNNGNSRSANKNLSILLLHQALEPVRNEHFIADMPEEQRDRARQVWDEARKVYDEIDPLKSEVDGN